MAARQALVRLEETGLKKFRKDIFLAVVFMISLPVFAWLRWEPAPWLYTQLAAHGLSRYVHVAKVEKSGLELILNNVRVNIPQGPDLSLNGLHVSPAWSRIMRGDPALHARGEMADTIFMASVSIRHGTIRIRDIDVHAHAEAIKDYFPSVAMLNLAGPIQLSGEIQLRQSTGLPITGHLVLQWLKAGAGALGADDLGNFRMQLSSSAGGRWRWRAKGGSILSLDGSGYLSTASPNPGLWQMDGSILVRSHGRVASLLSGLTGSGRGKVVLSGNLSRPRLKFLRP